MNQNQHHDSWFPVIVLLNLAGMMLMLMGCTLAFGVACLNRNLEYEEIWQARPGMMTACAVATGLGCVAYFGSVAALMIRHSRSRP